MCADYVFTRRPPPVPQTRKKKRGGVMVNVSLTFSLLKKKKMQDIKHARKVLGINKKKRKTFGMMDVSLTVLGHHSKKKKSNTHFPLFTKIRTHPAFAQ